MIETYIVGADGFAASPAFNEAAAINAPLTRRLVKLRESMLNYIDNYIDPLDALRDDDTGELWQKVGASDPKSANVLIETPEQLKQIRDECRMLAIRNEFAINGHENRISYIVGSGHKYQVQPATGKTAADGAIERAQQIVDEFIRVNRWHARQQEIVRRRDRDGECFLRLFERDGTIRVRFVEPGQVETPSERSMEPDHSWGIITEPDDVETVLGYWIDGKEVPASEIQHRKLGTDFNVKRGTPLFFPVRKNLRRAEKLLRNMTVVAEIQSAIAMIRKHQQATKSTVESLVSGNAEASVYDNSTAKTRYFRQYAPGTIIDAPAGMEYDFPSQGIDSSRLVIVLQAELRAVASRLVMPEFMLTSDASNANYSSTMVAEGPAVKMFERLQAEMIEDDRTIMERVLDAATAAGRITQGERESIEVGISPPRLETRDRKSDVEANVQSVTAKIMSKHTARQRDGLDPDFEEEQIEAENEASLASNPFAGMVLNAKQGADDGGDEGDDSDDGEGGSSSGETADDTQEGLF